MPTVVAIEPVSSAAQVRFGQLLRRFRAHSGLTQQELADLSTISVRAIRDLEHGKARRPRPDTVRLIADGLRLSRQARLDLELAADHGRADAALLGDYDAHLAPPPRALSPVVGRETEAEALCALLSSGGSRLTTVAGLGGAGKTSLAREVARLLHARHGMPVLWAGAPIRDERLRGLVDACVAELLDPARPDPRPDRSPGVTDLAELVGGRATLLVLDDAAAHPLRADRVLRLLEECSGLRVLLTARRCGLLPGERAFLLAPLETPVRDADAEHAPAVRLFLDLARRALPDFRPTAAELPLVAELCRELDGLPSALEAAASWLAVYDLELLLAVVRGDAAGLFDHLAGAERGSGVRERIEDCVRGLSAGERSVLVALCGRDGACLPEVVELTGSALSECGRLLRGLVLAGVVRTCGGGGQTRFRVLNLVRALVAPCAVR